MFNNIGCTIKRLAKAFHSKGIGASMLVVIVIFLCFTSCNVFGSANNSDTTNSISGSEATNDPKETEPIVDEHIHQYDEGVIVTKATCNLNGTKKYTCTDASCGYSYTESYTLAPYTATEIYNQSVKYVGEIITYDKCGNELALGTGFVISSDGKILTVYYQKPSTDKKCAILQTIWEL